MTDMSPVLDELTKKSIDLLSRIIKKPPLSQKLLAKPPFRYLHDMFTEIVSTTGFGVGLYSDFESNSENVKDKDSKVAYLTKMIDTLGIATGVEIRANPLKIVAGLEPEETNAFLQLIAKVVLKKIDSSDAVARVLAGEHQGQGQAVDDFPPPRETPKEPAKEVPVQREVQKESPVQREVKKDKEEPGTPPAKHAQKSHAAEPSKLAQKIGSINDLNESIPAPETAEEEKPAPKSRARPISARPPPPKKKAAAPSKNSAPPTIISDTQRDDEDDEFIVRAVDTPVRSSSAAPKDEKHGGLVQKILQTKKELEGEKTESKPKVKESTAFKEIEALRETIQILCQSTNPLGKTMDYIQEDADAMNKELEHWKKESARTKSLLDEEVKMTKDMIQPLEVQLKDIEDAIDEQLEKISHAKAAIIQGDSVALKLLRNMTASHK